MIAKIINNLKLWGLAPDKIAAKYGWKAAPKILANSIPKSGTHLLERLLYLLPGISRQFAGTFWVQDDLPLFQQKCARLQNGQFMVSHLFYREEYPAILDEHGIKPILMIRDPRDVVISNVNYITRANKKHRLHDFFANHLQNDKERLHCCIKGSREPEEYSIGCFSEKFYPWTQSDKVLTIRFEDLIGQDGGGSEKAQKQAVDRILDFISVGLKQEERRELIKRVFYTRSKTFNKGCINQWNTVFDDDDKKLFKEVAGDWLIKYGYEKDFGW